ncbi:DUF6301 family protein [Actinosynnema sp. ALI-1.44]|uniref:DUF6301 family protein n=1 Tax=Actinosynnema sp. ALI-1.44 TaxID=1933779 RepID=UPI00192D1362|nr:DUF6301 family protein [Actinosynnema sp. ALI-1.44]
MEWCALTGVGVVELATRLWSHDWSWRMQDVPELAAAFGWRILRSRPQWVMLDSGFGMASGKVRGRDGLTEEVQLRVTDFVTEDAAGAARLRDAFAGMATALTGAFGDPTVRIPGKPAEVRWAGAGTTLVLANLVVSVELSLVTNSWLVSHDEMIEMERQGLL